MRPKRKASLFSNSLSMVHTDMLNVKTKDGTDTMSISDASISRLNNNQATRFEGLPNELRVNSG